MTKITLWFDDLFARTGAQIVEAAPHVRLGPDGRQHHDGQPGRHLRLLLPLHGQGTVCFHTIRNSETMHD